jgi:hypothetical protein
MASTVPKLPTKSTKAIDDKIDRLQFDSKKRSAKKSKEKELDLNKDEFANLKSNRSGSIESLDSIR